MLRRTCCQSVIRLSQNKKYSQAVGFEHLGNVFQVPPLHDFTSKNAIVPALQHGKLFLAQCISKIVDVSRLIEDAFGSIFLSSTMKKRRMKMNKHKVKKRRKKMRMNTKITRQWKMRRMEGSIMLHFMLSNDLTHDVTRLLTFLFLLFILSRCQCLITEYVKRPF